MDRAKFNAPAAETFGDKVKGGNRMSKVEKEDVFVYLDALRESGVTNMVDVTNSGHLDFVAAPYIVEEFGVDKRTARQLLAEWMVTFSERHKEDE